MAKFTASAAGVQVLDGAQVRNNIIKVGSTSLRMCIGTVGVRTYDDMMPRDAGGDIIIPPGLRVTFFCKADETNATLHMEDFGA